MSPRTTQAVRMQFHSLIIQRHRGDAGARGLEHHRRANVPGFFHGHPVAWIQKNARDQIERFLHSGHDRYLVGHAVHSA